MQKRIEPSYGCNERVYLDTEHTCWVDVGWLPQELIQYGTERFDELWNLHPEERLRIVWKPTMQEMPMHRWQQSYLQTPSLESTKDNGNVHFMYSSLDESANTLPLPSLFQPFHEFMLGCDARYNQVVANWYDGDDYIAQHRDCTTGMINESPIAMCNIEPNAQRHFSIVPNRTCETPLYPEVLIPLANGITVTMGGETQQHYKHGVASVPGAGRRISLSFRCMQ
jgi:alkylated DNA repair dioxygenase AlkB